MLSLFGVLVFMLALLVLYAPWWFVAAGVYVIGHAMLHCAGFGAIQGFRSGKAAD